MVMDADVQRAQRALDALYSGAYLKPAPAKPRPAPNPGGIAGQASRAQAGKVSTGENLRSVVNEPFEQDDLSRLESRVRFNPAHRQRGRPGDPLAAARAELAKKQAEVDASERRVQMREQQLERQFRLGAQLDRHFPERPVLEADSPSVASTPSASTGGARPGVAAPRTAAQQRAVQQRSGAGMGALLAQDGGDGPEPTREPRAVAYAAGKRGGVGDGIGAALNHPEPRGDPWGPTAGRSDPAKAKAAGAPKAHGASRGVKDAFAAAGEMTEPASAVAPARTPAAVPAGKAKVSWPESSVAQQQRSGADVAQLLDRGDEREKPQAAKAPSEALRRQEQFMAGGTAPSDQRDAYGGREYWRGQQGFGAPSERKPSWRISRRC